MYIDTTLDTVIIHTKEDSLDSELDNGDYRLADVLETIGFGKDRLQYSLDGGKTFQTFECDVEFQLSEFRDCSYFSKNCVYMRGWSA